MGSRAKFRDYKKPHDKERWTQIPNEILEDPTLSCEQKMVWIAIAKHQWEEGKPAWPSQATIAKLSSLSVRTVRRMLAELKRKGYTRIKTRPGQSSEYMLRVRILSNKANPPRTGSPTHPGQAGRGTPDRLADEVDSLNRLIEKDKDRASFCDRKSEKSKPQLEEPKRRSKAVKPSPDLNGYREAAARVLAHLSWASGLEYKPEPELLDPIAARLAAGASEAECVAVIDDRARAWGDSDAMSQHLRPSTLFGPRFAEYRTLAQRQPESLDDLRLLFLRRRKEGASDQELAAIEERAAALTAR